MPPDDMSAADASPPLVAIVGPTAAGKSGLAIAMAVRLGGEVVNADSMQLYRGMDIGTAKLDQEQRRGIPHHVLDVLDVTEPATVAQFQSWARAAIRDCRSRGATPILVGGSALYVRAVLDRFDFPGTDDALRAELEAELAGRGPAALHQRLAAVDPVAAESILPGNGRRIVRALEVVTLTGKPFAANLPRRDYAHVETTERTVQIGVDVPRPTLDERIDVRVQRMWDGGLVDEVRRLEAAGLRSGRTASRALGYAQVLQFLAGHCTEAQARQATVQATRRFARRQDSWFRKDERVRWLPYDAADLSDRGVALVGASR
ncbi:tRNA (adenosine(37)-N6)-dimethylallyltransferase MiaA [soil metagenome]